MARRSNKTAHVLGLITAGAKTQEAPEDLHAGESVHEEAPIEASNAAAMPATEAEPANEAPLVQQIEAQYADTARETSRRADADNEPTPESPAHRSELSAPSAQPISPSGEDADPAAEPPRSATQPQRSPLQEGSALQRMVTGSPRIGAQRKAPIVEILFNDHDPLSDVIRDQLEAAEAMVTATRKEQTMNTNQPEAPAQNPGATIGNLVTKSVENDRTYITDRITHESKELNYKYLNIPEELVREKVLETMETVEMCTCDRCIIDTIALAVTHLPSKCIVADKDAIFPLLSYYRSKYATSVQTELMKAAMLVKENPHH